MKMKRELSKIAIGLVGLAVQFLPAQAWGWQGLLCDKGE